jgi:hypothetical protein
MVGIDACLEVLIGTVVEPARFFWDDPVFASDRWATITKGIRIALAAGTALLIMYDMRAARLKQPPSARVRKRLALCLTAVAFVTYFDFFNPNTRYSEYYHRHEFYHYYLGSKFSQELGYTRLYECTFVAEIENGHAASIRKRQIRNLETNLLMPSVDTHVFDKPELCKQHFTTSRWDAFKRDVAWFHQSAAGSYWEGMQHDHGYNPPPVWTMTGKLFANLAPAGDTFFKLLAGIDVALHLGIVGLFYWAFGWRVATVATVYWSANAPADFLWTGGAFLRQDWLFLLVAALCLARKRHFVLAGYALTWSALLRVFPALFFVSSGIVIALSVFNRLRHGVVATQSGRVLGYVPRAHQRFVLGCVLALATLVPLSVAVCGPRSWVEFRNHTLKTHSGTPLTNHMGLPAMLTHNWKARMRFMRNDNQEDAYTDWKNERRRRFQQLKWVWQGSLTLLFGWTVWALRRTRQLWIGLALGIPLVMSVENLTCYYYSFFILGAALSAVRPNLAVPFLVTSAASKVIQYSPSGFYWMDDRWVAESYLYFLLSCLFLYGYSRPFSWRRLENWWRGRPDAYEPPAVATAPPHSSA